MDVNANKISAGFTVVNQEARIRPMQKKDWPAFDCLDAELFPDDRMTHEGFQHLIEGGAFFTLELRLGGLIGVLAVARFGDTAAHLGRIGVLKSMQRKGYGSQLMEFALKWVSEQRDITEVILYTQDFNLAAQGLYKKFGFKIVGTTWHYFVPFKIIQPQNEYSVQPIMPEEINEVGNRYSHSLPAGQIRRFLEQKQLVMTLKDSRGEIIGICRFTPSFPGCFPFEINHVSTFDDFLDGLRPYSLPKFDYIRVTFTDNPDLAQLLEARKCRLHHKLFKMVLELS